MKIIILCLHMLLFVSCKGSYKHDVRSLTSKTIKISSKSSILRQGQDTIITDFFESNYKTIIYTDSTSCSSCALGKLHLWKDLIEWAEQYNGALKFYFIFSPPKGENIRLALRNSMLDYPMLLDSLGEFERLNPHLPKNKAMHTFLLDENNNVVLVGNPLHNPKIEKMFKEIIEEKLGKKE